MNRDEKIDKKTKNYIDYAIDRTIKELKKQGLLKDSESSIYKSASKTLEDYYARGTDAEHLSNILADMSKDPYFDIIPMYFEEKQTMEAIAERLHCDVTTTYRNKKRLCLEVYAKKIIMDLGTV